MMIAAVIPPDSGGIATITVFQSSSLAPISINAPIRPQRLPREINTVFQLAKSSPGESMEPMWTTITSMAKIPRAEKPDTSIISFGMTPLQNPRRNSTAATNTEGTKAFVFADTISPITKIASITTAH